MEVVAVIPARGGSKTMPRKNVAPFLGKPLIFWSIRREQANRVRRHRDEGRVAPAAIQRLETRGACFQH